MVSLSLRRLPFNGLTFVGRDNWNAFGCDVSEELLLQTGQLIVDYGLKDLGFAQVPTIARWGSNLPRCAGITM
jgi:hypothetical protein